MWKPHPYTHKSQHCDYLITRWSQMVVELCIVCNHGPTTLWTYMWMPDGQHHHHHHNHHHIILSPSSDGSQNMVIICLSHVGGSTLALSATMHSQHYVHAHDRSYHVSQGIIHWGQPALAHQEECGANTFCCFFLNHSWQLLPPTPPHPPPYFIICNSA